MPLPTENSSSDLFEYIRAQFEMDETMDEAGQPTDDPSAMKLFSFDYTTPHGVNLGNVVISLLDDGESSQSLKVYYSKDISDLGEDDALKHFHKFLHQLRLFAKSRMLGFDIRDIAKSRLQRNDITSLTRDSRMTESRFSTINGTSKISVQTLESVRIRIHHSEKIDETQRGARTRKIDRIYMENALGERFLMPFTSLKGARAMAEHMRQGGAPHDNIGSGITNLVVEARELGKFVRRTRNRVYESDRAMTMVETAKNRYFEVKKQLERMAGPKGYALYRNDLTERVEILETEDLSQEFQTRNYDNQLDTSLPYVWRAYQMSRTIKEFQDFKSWVNETMQEATVQVADPKDLPAAMAAAKNDKEAVITLGEAEQEGVQTFENFVMAAQSAKDKGASHFKYNGKTYPVQISKKVADEIKEEIMAEYNKKKKADAPVSSFGDEDSDEDDYARDAKYARRSKVPTVDSDFDDLDNDELDRMLSLSGIDTRHDMSNRDDYYEENTAHMHEAKDEELEEAEEANCNECGLTESKCECPPEEVNEGDLALEELKRMLRK